MWINGNWLLFQLVPTNQVIFIRVIAFINREVIHINLFDPDESSLLLRGNNTIFYNTVLTSVNSQDTLYYYPILTLG